MDRRGSKGAKRKGTFVFMRLKVSPPDNPPAVIGVIFNRSVSRVFGAMIYSPSSKRKTLDFGFRWG